MRLAAYAGASAVLAGGALVKAFSERPNFYSATVYLSQSNACILILANLVLVCAISSVYGLQRLLYGPLRPVEVEQLSEKAWYAVLDTLLAMPALRDDVGGWLVAIFFTLLAGKIWGWIAEGRVDLLEQQTPQRSRLFHVRLVASLALSLLFDALMVRYCLRTVMANPRPGMMIIFTFEFAILCIASQFTTARYALALVEARFIARQTASRVAERKMEIRAERLEAIRAAGSEVSELVEPTDDDVDENEIDVPGWEEKRKWLFGLELATDFIKIVIYTVFFTISMAFMGLPMHVMRDVYLTIASFTKRIQDYANYRRATQDMNTRYPDATEQELSNDSTCIVCRETMVQWNATAAGAARNEGQRAKKLPCGHILHLRCLKAWLERQQVCPTCRRPVIPTSTTTRSTQLPAQPGAPRAGGGPGAVGDPRAVAGGQVAAPAGPGVRARWLNLGPVRLGFVGGPYQQVREALNRANDPIRQANGVPISSRSLTPLTNEQHLRTVELRLLQDAHNLQVDRAQLATVRALEMELSRLRELRVDPAVSTPTSAFPAASTATNEPLADLQRQLERMRELTTQLTRGLPNQQPTPPMATMVQRYQADGTPTQAAALPAGMVLPEGWTLTPLTRTAAPPVAPAGLPLIPGFPVGFPPSMSPTPTHPLAIPRPPDNQPMEPDQATQQTGRANSNSTNGISGGPQDRTHATPGGRERPQTDDDDAPAATMAVSGAPDGTTTSTAPPQPIEQDGAPRDAPSWGFTNTNGGDTAGPAASAVSPRGVASSSSNAIATDHDGAESKGKSRAVTVEDVPDEDS